MPFHVVHGPIIKPILERPASVREEARADISVTDQEMLVRGSILLNKKWRSFLLSNGMVEYEGPLRVRGALCILTILTFPTEIFSSSGLEIYLLLFNVSSGTASSGAPSLLFQIHSMRHATSLLYISREGLNLVRPTGGLEHVLSALPGYVGIMDIVFRSWTVSSYTNYCDGRDRGSKGESKLSIIKKQLYMFHSLLLHNTYPHDPYQEESV